MPTSSTLIADDPPAQAFMRKCASCHTVGGGAIGDSPDLLSATRWPLPDLKIAVERMEKNVGPLTQEEIDAFAGLLGSPDVKQRLEDARDRMEAQRRVKMEPARWATGRALFHGEKPLGNGGMACSSCHVAGGQGGSLAVDLTGVYGRMGYTALLSAVENTNFPLMKPAYATHPVTSQEAAHLTEYLKVTNERALETAGFATAAGFDRFFGWAGLAAAVAALLAMVSAMRRLDRGGGVRQGLVQRATRSNNR